MHQWTIHLLRRPLVVALEQHQWEQQQQQQQQHNRRKALQRLHLVHSVEILNHHHLLLLNKQQVPLGLLKRRHRLLHSRHLRQVRLELLRIKHRNGNLSRHSSNLNNNKLQILLVRFLNSNRMQVRSTLPRLLLEGLGSLPSLIQLNRPIHLDHQRQLLVRLVTINNSSHKQTHSALQHLLQAHSVVNNRRQTHLAPVHLVIINNRQIRLAHRHRLPHLVIHNNSHRRMLLALVLLVTINNSLKQVHLDLLRSVIQINNSHRQVHLAHLIPLDLMRLVAITTRLLRVHHPLVTIAIAAKDLDKTTTTTTKVVVRSLHASSLLKASVEMAPIVSSHTSFLVINLLGFVQLIPAPLVVVGLDSSNPILAPLVAVVAKDLGKTTIITVVVDVRSLRVSSLLREGVEMALIVNFRMICLLVIKIKRLLVVLGAEGLDSRLIPAPLEEILLEVVDSEVREDRLMNLILLLILQPIIHVVYV